MKNLNYFILTFFLLSLLSCENKEEPIIEEIPCENDCLFTVQEEMGTIIFMECFQKYGIQTLYPDDPEMNIYGIPAGLDKAFEVEGKEVTFSAAFRENTLVPQFPDPSFNMESIFEIEIFFIE